MTRTKQTVQWTVIITLLTTNAGARVHARIPEKSEEQEAKVARVISGTVLDPSGASVAGAKVILAGAGGETIGATTTDISGGFRFEKAGQDKYQIRVQAEGFQNFKTEISAGAKALSPLQIVLTIKEQNEVVTVGTTDFSPQVTADVSENQNANMLDRSTLDRVPVFDQDYITTMSRFLDDSAAGTSGVTLIVNGIEANGPGVTPSAVQEVKINQNPYSARFARPGRARLEITMKGGTPNYHGSVNFMFRDSMFDARNAFAQVKPAEQRRYYEGSLTGPVGKSKKTTFLLSLDRDEEDQQAIVVAQGIQGAIHENVPAPTRHFFGSGRIFHDFTNGDQFWIGYSYEQGTNQNVGVGGNVLPEAGSNINFLEQEINVSYRHVFSTKWVNQLRFLVGHYDRPVTSVNESPQIAVTGAFTGGGAQADSRRTEYHFDGTDIVTYVSGKHELNFGIDIPDISRRGEDDFTNIGGTYKFASLADFAAGRPATFLVQRGQGHLVFLETLLSGFIEDTIRLKPNFSITVGARYYWQNYFHDEPHDLAPRFGFAYAPTKNSKTVIRGGAGVFFDRTGPRPIADLLHFNGANLLRFIVENPLFPVTPVELSGVPTSEVVLDPRAKIPYTVQYSIGVERQVTEKSTFSATYVGSRGIDLYRSRDINAPPPPNFLARPDAALGQVRQMESEGYQKSNALELTFRGRPSKYFTGQVQYTLGKTYNNTSGITYFPGNSFFPAADWARSDNDRRHKFDLLGSTQASRFFTVGAALSLYSGKPVNVTTGGDNNHDGVLNDRPAGFTRNTLHGPGMIELDVNLEHDFLFSKSKKEGPRITAALNAFNVLNHTNDTTFVGTITSPFFGQAVSAQPPRRIQLNVQFKF
jgi:carboxypeptidase family protein